MRIYKRTDSRWETKVSARKGRVQKPEDVLHGRGGALRYRGARYSGTEGSVREF